MSINLGKAIIGHICVQSSLSYLISGPFMNSNWQPYFQLTQWYQIVIWYSMTLNYPCVALNDLTWPFILSKTYSSPSHITGVPQQQQQQQQQ